MACRTLVLLALALAFGCKGKTEPGGGGGSAATGPESAAEDGLDALSNKQNAYVDCLNEFSGDIHRSRARWMDQFPDGPNAAKQKESLYGPTPLRDVAKCKSGVEAAQKQKPSLPELETAGAAYVAALVTLEPLSKDANTYFQAGNYKDDKLAHAIELHPKLVAAWDAFDKADDALEAQVDKLEDQIQGDRLAQVEKAEGKKLQYLHLTYLIAAKKVMRFAGDIESPEEVELAPYTAAIGALDKALTDLVGYYDTNKAEVEKSASSYWTFVDSAKSFVKDAKDLMRRKRDNEKFSSGEKMTIEANNPEAVTGHPRAVSRAYNSMIDSSNRLRW